MSATAITPAPPQEWSRRTTTVLVITAVAVFMSFLDVTIVNIAFRSLAEDFSGNSATEVGWVLNAYAITFAAALVPAGVLAERVGRRRVFMTGVALFTLASGASALAPTLAVVVAARIVQALGAAALVPTSLALLLPEVPLARRATATAMWSATGAVAAAVGPALGGVLVGAWGWRAVFLVNLPIGLAVLASAASRLTKDRAGARVSTDWLSAALLGASVASLTWWVVEVPDDGWTSPAQDTRVAVAVLLAVVMVARTLRSRTPLVDPALFRIRAFSVSTVASFVFGTGFYSLLLANVLYLTGAWGWSVTEAGVALTPGALMAAIASPLGGRAVDRFGPRAVAVPGLLLFSAGASWLALHATATPSYAGGMLPGMLMTGTGIGLTLAALGAAAVLRLPREHYSVGSAVSSTARQIGAAFGIAVLLVVVSGATGLDGFVRSWWLIAAAGAATLLVALLLGRVRAADVSSQPEAQLQGRADSDALASTGTDVEEELRVPARRL